MAKTFLAYWLWNSIRKYKSWHNLSVGQPVFHICSLIVRRITNPMQLVVVVAIVPTEVKGDGSSNAVRRMAVVSVIVVIV